MIRYALLLFVLSAVGTTSAKAAFILSGTRYIYEEGKKNISMEITNTSKDTYGGQVWIDNSETENTGVFMVPSPPFFKLDAKQKQVLRLMNVNTSLPKDRESLFYVNVQEIPPKPKQVEGSIIAIAMNTRVKLLYRPKSLIKERNNAESQLLSEYKNGHLWLKNPTPYYFAITSVKVNGKAVVIPKENRSFLATLKPNDEVNTGITQVGSIAIGAINDWGGEQFYEIH
ncbi:fimbrial chaperone [Enterobacter roggenkampii]